MANDASLAQAYARAKALHLDFWADETLDRASGARRLRDARAINAVFSDDKIAVMRDRLATDAAKWTLSKLRPKEFGDKIIIDQGEDKKVIATTDAQLEEARNAWLAKHGSA